MKIHGKKLSGPSEELIVLPRGEEQIVFKAKAVLTFDEFEENYPAPEPPTITKPGKAPYKDPQNAGFLKKLSEWSGHRTAWMILKSLESTEGLEWETVDMSDPTTWGNYEKELKEAGISDIEVGRIVAGVMSANSLDEEKIEEARKRFLASRLPADSQESPQVGEQ